jgi:hypothetical protein
MWFAIELVSNGYCCVVDIWLTFSTIMSFLTCTYQFFQFVVEKTFPSCKKYFAITFRPFLTMFFNSNVDRDIIAKEGFFY